MSEKSENKDLRIVNLTKKAVIEILPKIESMLDYSHLKILIALLNEPEERLQVEQIKKITGLKTFGVNLCLKKLEKMMIVSIK